MFVKYDILITEYLTLFWSAMLVNEYKLYVSMFISAGPPLL
jgi:hypothetical protein